MWISPAETTEPAAPVRKQNAAGESDAAVPPTDLLDRLRSRLAEFGCLAAAVVFAALVTGYRFSVAGSARYPGHADPAFAYGVAQNIHAGRGPDIDYVWHFLAPAPTLRHYAFDYWLPLPSQLMAVALDVGKGLPSVLKLNILLVLLIGIGSYLLARSFSNSPWVPAVAAAAVVVQPVVSNYAMQAESAVYFGAFAIWAMAAAVHARQHWWLWLPAGALAALAGMCRSEGLLLIIVLGIAALAWTEQRRWYFRLGLLVLGYLPVSAPFLYQNLKHFGSLTPPAASAFPFINNYEDLFAPHVPRTLHALLAGSPKRFFELRITALNAQLSSAFGTMSPVVAVLCLMLVGAAVFQARSLLVPAARWQVLVRTSWFVPAGFLVLVFLFDAGVAPVISGAGATVKVMATGVPILVVAAVVQLSRSRLPVAVTALACAALVLLPLVTLANDSRSVVRHNNEVGQWVAAQQPALNREQACLDRPLVLMTRDPWEFNQVTGFPTVQLPTGSLADILAVARKYGATDVQDPSYRPALHGLAKLVGPGRPFSQPSTLTGQLIYRINSTTAGAHC
ncbi:MAG TPA: glycosyltransferase family 39 protein [Jatrophihabitans sp.]|nr:glycosyltransferase family 39 protein [Jatrophihabitans sp.]